MERMDVTPVLDRSSRGDHGLREQQPAEQPVGPGAGPGAERISAGRLEVEPAEEPCKRIRRLHAAEPIS